MAVTDTQRELSYRKRLIEIANLINSAPSIQEILVGLKDRMLDLVDAERVTIFALDTKNQELFSLFKAGQEVREIRVPKSFASIAGFTALSRKTANIANVYDASELAAHHPNMRFDVRWDKSSGFKTTQLLSAPILYDKYLLGVLQLVNKRGGGSFSARDVEAAEELAKILGIAFYNQHRATRTNKPSKFGALVDKGLASEKDIEKAISAARVNQTDVAKILLEEFRIPKDEILQALAHFYGCASWAPSGALMPEDLKQRASADFLKKNVCAPLDRREGTVRVAVEDPYDLTRLDSIKAMNLAPRYEFLVGLRDDILAWVRASYGETGPVVDDADLSRIINDLGTGEEGEAEEAEDTGQPEIDETDSGVMRLCNQIIIDAYNKGASDIHVEPYGKIAAHDRAAARRRGLREVHRGPRAAQERPGAALQDHGEARHRREAPAAGRQDPLPRPDGHDRAARRHDPDHRRQRGHRDAHPRGLASRCRSTRWASWSGTSASSRRSCRSRTASAWSWDRPARARRRRCTRRSASSTPRT